MSSRITIKSSPALAGGGLVAIIVGLLMMVGGGVAWAMVSQQLADEKIYVADDAAFFQGQLVNNPIAAYAQADVINKHALEASGGKTYAELAQDDPTRAVVMNAAFLRSSLFTSVVSFGVALLAAATGFLFVVVGWSMRKASIGNPVVVETDTPGPVQVENTRGKTLQGQVASTKDVVAVPTNNDGNATRRQPNAESEDAPTTTSAVATPTPSGVNESAAASVIASAVARSAGISQEDASTQEVSVGQFTTQRNDEAHSVTAVEPAKPVEPARPVEPVAATTVSSSTAELPVRQSVTQAAPMPRRVPSTTFPNMRSSSSALSSASTVSSASAASSFSAVSAATAATPIVAQSQGVTASPSTSHASVAPVAPTTSVNAGTSPFEGLTGTWSKPSAPETLDTPVVSATSAAAAASGFATQPQVSKPETLPTPVIAHQGLSSASPVSPVSPQEADNSQPRTVVSPQVVYGDGQTTPPTRSSVSSRSAVSASTGALPTIPSFDELISPSNSSSLSHASRSERALNDSRKRFEEEKSRTGMTGTIPIVGETRASRSTQSASTPNDSEQSGSMSNGSIGIGSLSNGLENTGENTGESTTEQFQEPKPVTGAVSWQRPQDRLK